MPYPRIYTHRGFNSVAPENTIPAFGAAVAMGDQKIELDLWATRDGVLVSCHNPHLDRVSNGKGKTYEHSYEELLHMDFGGKSSEAFQRLKIPTFEQILRRFAGQAILNIHVKIWGRKLPDDTWRKL